MNMSEEIITPQQLADNIKNKIRYVPTNETFEHADFIKSVNKIIDEYIFEDDQINKKDRKQIVFLNFGELSFPVDMLDTIYLRPTEDPYHQKIGANYAEDIRNSGWNISYKDDVIIRPQYLVKLKADTPIEK